MSWHGYFSSDLKQPRVTTQADVGQCFFPVHLLKTTKQPLKRRLALPDRPAGSRSAKKTWPNPVFLRNSGRKRLKSWHMRQSIPDKLLYNACRSACNEDVCSHKRL